MQLVLDIPERHLLDETEESLASRFKLYTALMMYRAGELSAGAACELASVNRYTFLKACRRHEISTIGYSPDELESEVEWLTSGSTSSS